MQSELWRKVYIVNDIVVGWSADIEDEESAVQDLGGGVVQEPLVMNGGN